MQRPTALGEHPLWRAVVCFHAAAAIQVRVKHQPVAARPASGEGAAAASFLGAVATTLLHIDALALRSTSLWEASEPHPASSPPSGREKELLALTVRAVVELLQVLLDQRRAGGGGGGAHAANGGGGGKLKPLLALLCEPDRQSFSLVLRCLLAGIRHGWTPPCAVGQAVRAAACEASASRLLLWLLAPIGMAHATANVTLATVWCLRSIARAAGEESSPAWQRSVADRCARLLAALLARRGSTGHCWLELLPIEAAHYQALQPPAGASDVEFKVAVATSRARARSFERQIRRHSSGEDGAGEAARRCEMREERVRRAAGGAASSGGSPLAAGSSLLDSTEVEALLQSDAVESAVRQIRTEAASSVAGSLEAGSQPLDRPAARGAALPPGGGSAKRGSFAPLVAAAAAADTADLSMASRLASLGGEASEEPLRLFHTSTP